MAKKKPNPRKGSFARCVKAVKKEGSANDPNAVCGAALRKFDKKNPLGSGHWEEFDSVEAAKKYARLMEGSGKKVLRHGKAVRVDEKNAKKKTAKTAKKKNLDAGTVITTAMGHSAIGRHATNLLKKMLSRNPKVSAELKKLMGMTGAKKNPIGAAEKMFENFTGMPPSEVMEFVEAEHHHGVLAMIGPLIDMKVLTIDGKRMVELRAPDPSNSKPGEVVYCTISENGRQLFFKGGDQEMSPDMLSKFGMRAEDYRDHMVLGWVVQFTYRTKKIFEKKGKEEVDFYHEFGKPEKHKETLLSEEQYLQEQAAKGVLPLLAYYPLNPSMKMLGGRYFIADTSSEIGASPGVVG